MTKTLEQLYKQYDCNQDSNPKDEWIQLTVDQILEQWKNKANPTTRGSCSLNHIIIDLHDCELYIPLSVFMQVGLNEKGSYKGPDVIGVAIETSGNTLSEFDDIITFRNQIKKYIK